MDSSKHKHNVPNLEPIPHHSHLSAHHISSTNSTVSNYSSSSTSSSSSSSSSHSHHDENDLEEQLEWEEWNGDGLFLHHMIAGSCAGVSEHLSMYPIDTYKTHIQASRSSTTSSSINNSTTGGSFIKFIKKEGFFRLWRGASAVLLGCIPSHAAYFSMYEIGKEAFGVNKEGHHPLAAAATGALATIVHDGILTPMDVIKQRLQLGYYNGVFNSIKHIIQTEGIGALWRSYPTTLLMNIPYAAVVVATNESLKTFWRPITGNDSIITYLLSGAGAGAIAGAATCPLDVIKTRLQTLSIHVDNGPLVGTITSAANQTNRNSNTSSASSSSNTSSTSSSSIPRNSSLPYPRLNTTPSPLNIFQAQVATVYTTASASPSARIGAYQLAKTIWKEEGMSVFFRGVRARMAVQTPSQAISWAMYEFVKNLLNKPNKGYHD